VTSKTQRFIFSILLLTSRTWTALLQMTNFQHILNPFCFIKPKRTIGFFSVFQSVPMVLCFVKSIAIQCFYS
jgi:hypothetical protein